MRTLFFDVASHQKTIALVDDVKAHTQVLADHTDEAALLPAIEKLLKDNGQTFETLDRLATITGPGGFMSLRTGIALMNALQWQLKIPMAGIHLSDLWAARAGSGERVAGSNFLWIHSTKKEMFFISGFGTFKKLWSEAELITLADLQKKINISTSFVGEMLSEQKEKLPFLTEISDIRSIAEVLPAVIEAATFEKRPLLPWYGRGA